MQKIEYENIFDNFMNKYTNDMQPNLEFCIINNKISL